MKLHHRFLLLVFLLINLAACNPTPAALLVEPTMTLVANTVAPTNSPVPTLTPTLAPSPTKSATPTPLPSATAPTPTRQSTATLAPTNTVAPSQTNEPVVERGEVAEGFSLTVFSEVRGPTSLAFGPDSRLYVASVGGQVLAMADTTGDNRADQIAEYVRGLNLPLGLLWVENTLYISFQSNIIAVDDRDGDGEADEATPVLSDIPGGGLHQNDGMAWGDDGYIYLGMGSTCNVCEEEDPRNATILRFQPDGSELSVYATGLRNPYDVAFNAGGDLFATDNGRDDLGEFAPAEELNHIIAEGDYGWPDCWDGNLDTAECMDTIGAVHNFTARSSANGLVFYNGDNFPAEYTDNAFVAVLGSYEFPSITRGIKRIQLAKVGDTYVTEEAEWFLTIAGRPLDVTVGPEGALYVADFENSAIYRIVYGAP